MTDEKFNQRRRNCKRRKKKRKKKLINKKANIQQKELKVIVHCRKQKSEQWMPLGDWDGLSYKSMKGFSGVMEIFTS